MKKTREAVLNLGHILDFLWPRDCVICSQPSDRPGRIVCSDCLNRLPALPVNGCCRRCGRAAEGLDGEYLCEDCRTYKPAFDRASSAFHFDGEARELVNGYKFRNRIWLLPDLVDWLEATARARFKTDEIDLVVPMPSTWWHRLDRGFNQCAELAKALAKRLDLPYASNVMRRVGMPRRQGGLSEQERRENVIGTFRVRRPELVSHRTILVIDDIMTTGSTLSECAAELKLASADRVWCLTLARSVRF